MNLSISGLYNKLYEYFGETGWWPAETRDEVVIGAILTQNTSWSNVEKALFEMKRNGVRTLEDIASLPVEQLATYIRSSGFYNQKSRRLHNLATKILEKYGKLDFMSVESMTDLENFLLPINGIGQETMDSVLLYALDKPAFAVDKYTIRIFGRTGIIDDPTLYSVKIAVNKDLGDDVPTLKNFHGMLVYLAKDFCKTKPKCDECPVRNDCAYYKANRK